MQLTSAKLRYLMTVDELQQNLPHKVRCIDLAVFLGVARPSACRMLTAFCREGLLRQCREHGIELTADGEKQISPYRQEYQILTHYFQQTLGLSDYNAREAAMALLISAPSNTRCALCQSMSQKS
ncbi:MAG: metal-dependent transcriptional regulator [Candidatus Merdivicinus sp.]